MSGFPRPFHFGRYMNSKSYKTTVFSASYLHFSDTNVIKDKSKFYTEDHSDVSFVFLKTPSSAKSTIYRVLNMIAYYKKLFRISKTISSRTGKPDVIIASSPHPLAMIAGIKIAKKYNIPCICEIRDLWPEAIFAFGNTAENSILGKLLIKGEQWIYKKADALIFLKEGDTDYLKERKWTTDQGGKIDLKKCHYINNGVNLAEFYNLIKGQQLQDEDLLNNKFNVVYTGAIRPVNNVGNIVKAAEILKENSEIQFLIYGDGSEYDQLKNEINSKKLTNIKLKGYVDKKFIPYILSNSSVNILNYSESKYNWTRGNSSNKLFEYMASGKPIISTVKMGYSIITKHNCGIELDQNTPENLANAILKIKSLSNNQYHEMGQNAKNGAKEFDYKQLSNKLMNVLDTVLG